MSTILTHALAGAAVASAFPSSRGGRVRLALLGAVAGALPDVDSIGFALGVPYGASLGHRGLTHSLLAAALLGVALALVGLRSRGSSRAWGAAALVLAAATHGLLDAVTDGGLGVAFWAPFDGARHFLPWRPLAVPPIGLAHFRGEWARRVLVSEAIWVWLPAAALVLGVSAWRRIRRR